MELYDKIRDQVDQVSIIACSPQTTSDEFIDISVRLIIEIIKQDKAPLFAVLKKIIEAHKMSEVDWDAMREAEGILLKNEETPQN